jgi:hypothetical protein
MDKGRKLGKRDSTDSDIQILSPQPKRPAPATHLQFAAAWTMIINKASYAIRNHHQDYHKWAVIAIQNKVVSYRVTHIDSNHYLHPTLTSS